VPFGHPIELVVLGKKPKLGKVISSVLDAPFKEQCKANTLTGLTSVFGMGTGVSLPL
jgi:hypothetical protein